LLPTPACHYRSPRLTDARRELGGIAAVIGLMVWAALWDLRLALKLTLLNEDIGNAAGLEDCGQKRR